MDTHARLLVFANLNNPTSSQLTGTELRRIADVGASRGAYVLVDESGDLDRLGGLARGLASEWGRLDEQARRNQPPSDHSATPPATRPSTTRAISMPGKSHSQ